MRIRNPHWNSRLLMILLFLFILPAVWISASLPPNSPQGTGIFVEADLEAQISANGSAGYLIYFRDKADLTPAYGMNWQERGRFVMKALIEAANRSQERTRAFLDAQGARYKAFWIDNIIVVESSNIQTFNRLQNFPEIEALRARRTPKLVEPVDISPAAAISAIESNLSHVKADQVWALGYEGQGIVVGNIDTGVRYTHQALVNQYRGNLGGGNYNHNYNWWDPYDSTTAPADVHNHGSHTMGTMVGDDGDENQIGMAPGAKWIAAKGFNPNATDAGLLSCGQFMAAPTDLNGSNPDPDKRPHVVNNSWGDCGTSYDSWYAGVITSWHAAGIYPVFSNGNSSNCGYSSPPGLNTVGNPARSGNVTGVGATGRNNGQYATYSNWGPTDDPDTLNPRGYPNLKPQVVAPGTNRSAFKGSDSDYSDMSGTSMAAPHVAGLVALIWSAAPWLTGNYAATETIIEETANPIDYDSGGSPLPGPGNIPNYATGWGEIDALAAVQEAIATGGDSILEGQITAGAGPTATGISIQGALVKATNPGNTRETLSEEDGTYSMNLWAGDYTVTVSAYGYKMETVSDVTMTSGIVTTLNVVLESAAFYTVEGTVSDSATGWPLYAKIEIDGYPGDPLWTNPVTGYYSIELPEGTSFTLNTTAWVEGYLPSRIDVAPFTSSQLVDIDLKADPVTAKAPGYTFHNIYQEDFETDNGGFTTDGTPIDLWQWGIPVTWPGWSASGFKCWGTNLNGDYPANSNASIFSPVIDLSDFSAPLITSWWQASYVESATWDHAYAEVNINGGGWEIMWQHTGDTAQIDWSQKTYDLSAAAGGTAQFRFRLTSDSIINYAGYYVDNITIEDGLTVPTGGLVVGYVYDANTGDPLIGAKVENEDGYKFFTKATPDDPAVGDGFYTLYSPAGNKIFTGAMPDYSSESVETAVLAGDTVRQDFHLGAGQLLVEPSSLHATLGLGQTTTLDLTLTNTGDADMEFEIKEKASGFVPYSIKTRKNTVFTMPIPGGVEDAGIAAPAGDYAEIGVSTGIPAVIGPPSGGPAPKDIGLAWETMTPLPSARVFESVVADTNGYIYVIAGSSDAEGTAPTNTNFRYNTADDTWDTMEPVPASMISPDGIVIDNKIYIPGDSGTATTYVYDIDGDSWSSIAANNGYTARGQYQVVAIGTDLYVLGGIAGSTSTTEVWILDTISETWSAGVPMQKSRTSFSAAAINDIIYVAGGVYYPGFVPDMTAEKFDGDSWSYIAGVPNGGGAYTRWSYNADGHGKDGLWLGAGRRDAGWAVLNHAGYYNPDSDTWTDSPTIPTLSQGRVYMEGDVATDGYFYVMGGRDSAGATIYANNERLLVGSALSPDVPWLEENPTTGTLAGGESLVVSVTFDAGVPEVTEFGDYLAMLIIKNNTPYGSIEVPATMSVLPTGDLHGIITPQEAVDDGAKWRLLGDEDWLNNGYTLEHIPIGSYTVEFKNLTRWITPGNQDVTINADETTTVTGVYEIKKYTLTYIAGLGGTIDGETSKTQTVNHGEDGAPVTAVQNTGYHFFKWSDDIVTATRQDTNVTTDITVIAEFAINQYKLTYIAGSGGTIDGETSKTQTVNYGVSGDQVTALPDVGYHFVKWSDDSTDNPRTDTNVMDNITVEAEFAINQYTLTYIAGSGGSIDGETSKTQTVNYGASGDPVTAVPDTGRHFVKWSDDSTDNPRTDTNVTDDITVEAEFAINRYTLTYIAGAGGTIDGETSKTQTVNHGDSGTSVTAIPDIGYYFVQWSDDVTTATRQETNVTTDITVTANFGLFSDVYDRLRDYLLGRITDLTDLDINHDGKVDIADLVRLILIRH